MEYDPFKDYASIEDLDPKYFKPKTGGVLTYERLMEIIDELNSIPICLTYTPERLKFIEDNFYKVQHERLFPESEYYTCKLESLWMDGWYDKLFLHSCCNPVISTNLFPLITL